MSRDSDLPADWYNHRVVLMLPVEAFRFQSGQNGATSIESLHVLKTSNQIRHNKNIKIPIISKTATLTTPRLIRAHWVGADLPFQ